METFIVFAIVCILWIIVVCFMFTYRRNITGKRLPPGPGSFEVMSRLFQLVKQPLVVLDDWAKKYGSVFLITIGPKRILLLNDLDIAKRCFSSPAFVGRIYISVVEKMFGGNYGLAGTNGPHWEELRRFTLKELRDYGFGKPHIKSLIQQHALDLVESFRGQVGKPIILESAFNVAALSSLWSIVTGHSDCGHLHEVTERFSSSFLSLKDKWYLAWLPPGIPFVGKHSIWTTFNDANTEIDLLLDATIKSAQGQRLHAQDNPGNFLNSSLLQMSEKSNSPESVFCGPNSEKHLFASLKELWLASFLTTAVSLNWIILHLIKYPAVQRRLQEDIDTVVGNARHVTIDDRNQMPYIQAFIAEVYRVVSMFPVSGFHVALADDYLNDQFIPKDTTILVNVNYINNHQETWGDPENFRPERFLGDDGHKKMRQVFGSIFMVGKRSCPGQTLSLDTTFLFLSNILQNFEIHVPKGNNPPNASDYQIAMTFKACLPFQVVLSERK